MSNSAPDNTETKEDVSWISQAEDAEEEDPMDSVETEGLKTIGTRSEL